MESIEARLRNVEAQKLQYQKLFEESWENRPEDYFSTRWYLNLLREMGNTCIVYSDIYICIYVYIYIYVHTYTYTKTIEYTYYPKQLFFVAHDWPNLLVRIGGFPLATGLSQKLCHRRRSGLGDHGAPSAAGGPADAEGEC